MSFNMSRFLVRVRRFWTRNRLVPVLGITALLLFGLTSYHSLSSLFGEKPIIARHLVLNGNVLHEFNYSNEADAPRIFLQLENGRHRHDMNCEHLHLYRFRTDAMREQAEKLRIRALELQLEMEQKRLELERRGLMLENNDGADVVNNDDVIIKQKEEDQTFEITVNGKKIEIKQKTAEI